jgi:hypothetical protein
VEWFLFNSETLEEFMWNDRHIIHYMNFPNNENMMHFLEIFLYADDIPVYVNELRWLRLFQQIESRLQPLKVFRFAPRNALNFDDEPLPDEGL